MNKDLTNLVLSYFIIDINQATNYVVSNRPNIFAIHRSNADEIDNITFCLINYNKNKNIFYQIVDFNSIEIDIKSTNVLYINFTNGDDINSNNKTLPLITIVGYLSNFTSLDLVTTFTILKQKYSKNLAKMITVAKTRQLIDNTFQSATVNLLNNYLNLSTEFKVLNLPDLPIYFFNQIMIEAGRRDDIYHYDGNKDQFKQSLTDLAIDLDRMYKQIIAAVTKF